MKKLANNSQINYKFSRALLLSLILLSVSGCSTYKSAFNCSDAKGAYCVSMDRVDRMIDSGEIERFNELAKPDRKYQALKDMSAADLNSSKASKTIVNIPEHEAMNVSD